MVSPPFLFLWIILSYYLSNSVITRVFCYFSYCIFITFYLEHPEEIPIEHEFIGYRQDGDVAEDYQGNLYLVLCDPGIHPIGSVCMEQSELDDAVKLGKREDYTGELLEEIPE